MKYLKPNLDLIIAGLILVLSVVVALWLYGSWTDDLMTKAKGRLARRDQAEQQVFTRNKPIEIPGYGKLPGPKDNFEVTYGSNLIAAKTEAQNLLKRQADEVAVTQADYNLRGRVKIEGGHGKNAHVIPLLSGKEEDNFLPTITGGSEKGWTFKTDYEKQFPNPKADTELGRNGEWSMKLRFGLKPDPVAVELNSKTIPDEILGRIHDYTEELKRRATVAPGAPLNAAPTVGPIPPEELVRIRKGVISNRAASLRCYVDDDAFQKRKWFGGGEPPKEADIFEGLVDSWVINDVVNAIHNVNEAEFAARRLTEGQRNVGISPVKRLLSITIGGLEGQGNGLFLAAANSGSGMGPGPGMGMGGGSAASAGGTASLTGHVGNSEYDVVLTNIKVIVDPAYLNQFIDELYRQNNGYTVVNLKLSAVDPLDAASNGYLYGETQCVQAEIRVEDILFRKWTTPLMPPAIRTQVGLGATPAVPMR